MYQMIVYGALLKRGKGGYASVASPEGKVLPNSNLTTSVRVW